VAEARWAYDGAAQGGKIAFGNTWVVAALVVRLRLCPSPVALPVLFRLWRGRGTASQPQLAAQMVKQLAGAFPGRAVHAPGTRPSTGVPGHRGRDVDDAAAGERGAARAQAPAHREAGRPRAKGARIGTCKDAAVGAGWRETVIHAYGEEARVQVAARDALWYGSFKSAPGQLVLVRDPDSNKPYDLGIFTLDPGYPRRPPRNVTPGGGRSSRRTRSASSSPGPATPAIACRRRWSGRCRSRSWSSL
jgi:hypothetical protein